MASQGPQSQVRPRAAGVPRCLTSSLAQMYVPSGPPYAPQVASLGGLPTVAVDVPICAVFMALFVGSAVGNMTILQLNNRRGHKFIINAVMFGFSMARIGTLVLRIAWATHETNTSVAIAASIFVAAGIVLMFVVDLIFAQRILRAMHPNVGWHKALSFAFRAFYVVLVLSLFLLVGLTVTSFFTLDSNIRRVARDIQLYGQSAFLLLSFLPIPLVIGGLLAPRSAPLEKFGQGSWRTKVRVLLAGATLLTLGAAFRLGTNALPPRPITDPAWYQSKACFYCFNFVIEITVLYMYLIFRVDRRFHIPNGAKGPGDYSGRNVEKNDENPAASIPEHADESFVVLPQEDKETHGASEV